MYRLNYLFNKKNIIEVGNNFFLLGIFFLPTALPISAIFLLISLIISLTENNSFKFNDKLNFSLFVSIGLIIFSAINISFINKPLILSDYDISIIWINLFNWLPTFIYYWGFQKYLKTKNQRIIFSKYLLSGTFPVIISFIFQKFFHLYGPYKTLFGLIVWFQKPITNNYNPIAGLFSNPNYAAIWLVLVFPFAIFLLKERNSSLANKLILTVFCIFIFYTILLTSSRNGLLGIFITLICLYGYKKIILIFSSLFSLFYIGNFFEFFIQENSKLFNIINTNFLKDKLLEINIYNFPRFDIWHSTLSRIIERPLFGWGPSTFPFLHIKNNPVFRIPKEIIDAQHSHNIVLELAHNFGVPLSIILISSASLLILRSWKYIFLKYELNNNSSIEKAWLASILIIFISHQSDITFFDGKISICISILFAGLKCIIDENEKILI